jgi:predicted SAM-dependent methyltransferase
MLNISYCPVCSNNSFSPFLQCKDYTVSQEKFQIVSCDKCGFKFTNPRPKDDVIGSYYKSNDYVSHSNTNKGLINKLYHIVRSYTLSKKVKLINSFVSRGTVLDFGCGTGMFLSACINNGWKTIGMEPDSDARKFALLGNNTVYSNFTELSENTNDSSFDAITLWHVLEHVTDLQSTISYFKSKLSSNGVLIIAVPNYQSYDAKYYSQFWAAYDVPRHLYHFDVTSISALLDNFNFKLLDSIPMKFDSFYVSMLSEKYKTGKVNYLKAFLTGLSSNLKAQNKNSYSSTIYVFKHK